ncbi:hypothetical protein ACFX13_007597 [Malus domestica]
MDGCTLGGLNLEMSSTQKRRPNEKVHRARSVGEVGELSEILQWKGEVPKGLPDWKEEEKQHLGEEFSDVLLYLVRLSDFDGVDLGKAALRKFNALETGSCSSSVVFPDDGNLVDRLTSGQYSD